MDSNTFAGWSERTTPPAPSPNPLGGQLHEWSVELCPQRFFVVGIEPPLFHVSHDAYDLHDFAVVQVQSLADDILPRKN